MKTKYKNLTEFKKDIDSKVIDEEDLEIILDNDHTGFYSKSNEDLEYKIASTGGYNDIQELYSLLFPHANVEWC